MVLLAMRVRKDCGGHGSTHAVAVVWSSAKVAFVQRLSSDGSVELWLT